MPQANRITSWSYSRWNLWDQCGYKAKLKFLEKRPEPSSTPMERGNAVHQAVEYYLKGITLRLPATIEYLEEGKKVKKPIDFNAKALNNIYKVARDMRKKDPKSVFIEDTWAFRDDWSETRWDDWAGCWLRVKIDCALITEKDGHVIVKIHDWKTGRFRKNDELGYATQLDLYALSALTRYKDAKSVTVVPSLVYIDEGVEHSPRTYTLADLKPLKKEWEMRVKPMLRDTKFPPKPNRWCGFCTFRQSNGGPCKF